MAQLFKDFLGGGSAVDKYIVTLGTRGSAKTTMLGIFDIAASLLAIDPERRDPTFKYLLNERTSGLRQVPSDLCCGYFPPPTPPGFTYEADMILKWKRSFGDVVVTNAVCETAGEDMVNLIGPYSHDVYKRSKFFSNAKNLNKYICDAQGYILMCPVNRALIPGMPRLEEEPSALLQNPDVNLARILSTVRDYKKRTKSKEIEGIAVCLSKVELISEWCKANGMNLFTDEGAKLFLSKYFRQTATVLDFYGLDNVKFFPMYVEVEHHFDEDGNRILHKWPVEKLIDADGKPYMGSRGYKIVIDYERNIPEFSEQTMYDMIYWFRDVFAHR